MSVVLFTFPYVYVIFSFEAWSWKSDGGGREALIL